MFPTPRHYHLLIERDWLMILSMSCISATAVTKIVIILTKAFYHLEESKVRTKNVVEGNVGREPRVV